MSYIRYSGPLDQRVPRNRNSLALRQIQNLPRQEPSEGTRPRYSGHRQTIDPFPPSDDWKELLAQVAQVKDKIAYIEELVSSKQLAPADFRDMKSKYAEQLERLKARLAVREEDQDMPGLLDAGIDNLLKLDYIYQEGEIEKKREVIGSMYPGKLTFDGERLRTNEIEFAVEGGSKCAKNLLPEQDERSSGAETNMEKISFVLGIP
jgi:hypothetical protein